MDSKMDSSAAPGSVAAGLQFAAAEAVAPAGNLPASRAEKPAAKVNLAPEHTPLRRLLSLDALRGLTIAFMIMVNNNGGSGAWSQMKHSDWNGFTATDLVFPTFLFIVGVSVVFAFEARLARGATARELARHTATRAAILILFGIVVNSFPFFALVHMRFYGVLQRIALCYLAVGLFYLWDRRLSTKLVAVAVVLVGYWILVRWIPVPGAGLPGRDIPFLDQTQNIVAWVDRHLLPGHLYIGPPLFDTRDPEGLLSTIPAIGTCLLGLITGMGLRARRSPAFKTIGLLAGAAVCLVLGYLWSAWFPLNKKLWTSSFVLVAGGWSLTALAVFYWAIEQKNWFREGRSKAFLQPLLVFGSNAITAYMISELLPSALENIHFRWNGLRVNPISWSHLCIYSHIPNPGWSAFAYSLSIALICFVPVWVLYRNKIFLKI